MYIHIHLGSRHFDKKQDHGIDGRRQDVAIGLGDPMLNETVANEASIHENKNRIAIELLDFRLGNKTVQAHFAEIVWRGRPRPRNLILGVSGGKAARSACSGLAGGGARASRVCSAPPRRRLRQSDAFQGLHCRQRNQLVEGLASKNLVHTLAVTGHGRGYQQGIGRRVQLEMLLRMRQRVVGYERNDVGEFGRFRS